VLDRARPHLLPGALALTGLAMLAWLGLYGFGWNDYDDEARSAVDALIRGDLETFAALSPAYGGSLVLRAPFALVPSLWGGGELAVYRSLAVPCLAAAGALALVLACRMRASGQPAIAWVTVVALLTANPIALRALEIGHPEELLVASLCVGAVMAAAARRPTLAALLVGTAAAGKPWAVLAVPVVLALAEGRRMRVLLVTAAAAGAVTAPVVALDHERFAQAAQATTQTSQIFQPWQAWWFLGRPGEVVRGIDGEVKPGYRAAPAWLSRVSRPLIVLVAAALALAWWRRPRERRIDALALLALVFLLRCLLDPWDAVYYAIPAIFALAAWEGLANRQPPVLALGATVLTWITFQELPGRVDPDLQSLAYLAWSIPLAAWVALRVFGPRRLEPLSTRRWTDYGARKAAPIRGG